MGNFQQKGLWCDFHPDGFMLTAVGKGRGEEVGGCGDNWAGGDGSVDYSRSCGDGDECCAAGYGQKTAA